MGLEGQVEEVVRGADEREDTAVKTSIDFLVTSNKWNEGHQAVTMKHLHFVQLEESLSTQG